MRKKNLMLIEILRTILNDVQTLNIDYSKDNNQYYYDLAIGNLKDLIKTEIGVKK